MRQTRKGARRGGAKKLNVILDLDETVVHFLKEAKWAEVPDADKPKYQTHGTKNVFVLRPHLREFMNELFANYNVSIWTWSDADYANDVANILTDKHPEKFANIWSEAHANEAAEIHDCSKDLNYIWYTLNARGFQPCNTILVDDLPGNVLNSCNVKNTIQVKPFALFGEKKNRSGPYEPLYNDKTLLSVLKVLRKVADAGDFCATGDLPFPFPDHTKTNKPITDGSNSNKGGCGSCGRLTRRRSRRRRNQSS